VLDLGGDVSGAAPEHAGVAAAVRGRHPLQDLQHQAVDQRRCDFAGALPIGEVADRLVNETANIMQQETDAWTFCF
jgi:hypothetical protein